MSLNSKAQFGPTANFTANDTVICAGDSVTFTNLSTGCPCPVIGWVFPGGIPDSVCCATQNPTVVYNSPGIYDVTLVVCDFLFNCDTLTKPAYITVTGPSIDSLTSVNATCGASDGQATVYVSGGILPYTYTWNTVPAQTTATATGLASGNYTVTVTDAGGVCSATGTVFVNDAGAPTVTISSFTDASCGACDGTATALATGGTLPYTYLWNDPLAQNTPTADSLCPGTYSIIVTDSAGCSSSASVTISEPAGPIALISAFTNATCSACDGTATASAFVGMPPYTYLWNDPLMQNTPTADSLCPGIYNVIVTDANGCSDTASVTINQAGGPTASITGFTDATCGACDGTASVTAFGGTIPYTYLWSDPLAQNTPTADSLCPGMYNVIVTDANGCSDTASATINVTGGPTAFISSITDATCGACNGSASVSVFGGTTPYTYLWNDPLAQNTPTADSLCPGLYNVIVTDTNGCSDTAGVTINNIGGPTAVISNITDVSCNGGNDGSATVTAFGGTPPYTYQWNDPLLQTTDTATGLSAGTYTVTVTDDSGCVATASATINQPAAIAISFTSQNPTCNGGCNGSATANVTGGTSPYTYQWNDPLLQNTQTADNLCAGIYTVTVTDDNGCTFSASVVISNPAGMSLTTSTTNASCGNADGTATVTVTGGTSPYTYQWNDPLSQTTATADSLAAGGYSVTVTDSNGCTQTASVTISNTGGPSVTISGSVNVSCNGGNDGSATVSATGGTPPYTYLWNDPLNQITATATGLAAGAYNVIVTDSIGCSSTASVTITQPAALNPSITSSTNVSCNGGSDGSATVFVSGGITPYIYSWNTTPVQTNSTATGLSEGTYTVIVTDANGCTATSGVTINQPPVLNVSATGTDPACSGGCNGTASAGVTGGITPYFYQWSDPLFQTTANATGLCAGTYTVVVTDANGCNASSSVVISNPAGMSLTTSTTNASCGNADGSATVIVTGGTSPYTYQWNDPLSQTNATADSLAAGGYSVTVADSNGCTQTASVTINNTGGPAVTISGSVNVSCNGGNDGSAMVSATGGTPPYTYLWNDPLFQTTATATGLSAGIYNVIVTDSIGCSSTASVTITEPAALNPSITSSTNVSCNGGSDGSATVFVSGAIAPYIYAWNTTPVQTNPTATGLSAGTYTVIVTDANGCTATSGVTISQPPVLNISATGTDPACSGGCNGSASAGVTGGTIPYSYQWSDPLFQTTATAVGLCAGTYNVTVTDANGCNSTASVVLNNPAGMVLTTSATNSTCGNADGTASVSVTGGTAPYVYLWSNAQTNDTAFGLAAGGYSVTVTDANGCTQTTTVTVNDIGGPTLTVSGTDASCNGCSDGSATVSATSGTPPYAYLWNDPLAQTDSTATGLPAGIYTVIVTDTSGCSSAISVTISQPNTLNAAITSKTDASCNGVCDGSATVSVNGGTLPYTYLWDSSPVQTTAAATGLCAGAYTVTVTDSNGTIVTKSVTILQPSAISLTTTTTLATCGNADGSATVLASGGTGPYTYSWSGGGNQATKNGLAAGTYAVTVTDANGCTATTNATVSEFITFTLTTTVNNNISCNGGTGGATVSVTGGTAPFDYAWSSGDTTLASASIINSVTGLFAGTYTVLVTDAGGCSLMDSVTLGEPSTITAPPISSAPDTNNTGVGTATISASGGTPPYNYNWTPSGGTSSTATGLTAGTYTVNVTDANGCPYEDSVSVDNITDIGELNASGFTFDVYPNPNKGIFTIEFNNLTIQQFNNLTIYNILGEVVYTKDSIHKSGDELDIGSLPDGIYLIRLINENHSANKRIVIMK